MARNDDDASKWTPGDMARDQAELDAVSDPVPRGYTLSAEESYGDNKNRAEQMAKALRNVAKQEKEGAAVTVENTARPGRKPNYVVKVWRKK